MSFSQNVKNELCSIREEKDCCRRAEAYALVFFGRDFSKNEISLMTEHTLVAQRYAEAVEYLSGDLPERREYESGKIALTVSSPEQRMDILNELGYSGSERTYRLLTSNIENFCCFGAFLRGAFLCCGIATDPTVEYHLQFDVAYKSKSRDLCEFIEYYKLESEQIEDDSVEPLTLTPKLTERNGANIIYFKDSSHIEEILALMGAHRSALELINRKIYKDVVNNVNRKVNCDRANIRKTFNASTRQIEAIMRLKNSGRLDSLPDQLREIAEMRLNNPEMTLSELAASLDPPISRSGVNHRLEKIVALSQEI